ncbi:MAG: MobA/MobL family protein [Rhodomicrobium sp.]
MAIYSFNHDSFGKTTNRAGAAGDNAAYNARENETRLANDNKQDFSDAARNAAYNAREEATYAVRSHVIPPNPKEAEAWFREQEKGDRKNARMSDRFIGALPRELTPDQCIEAVESFCKTATQDRVPWHFALHLELDKKNESDWNPHAHIIIRDRDIETGRRFLYTSAGPRQRAELTAKGIDSWSTRDFREQWGDQMNRALERAGHDVRVDHRSLKEQGIDRTPTIHVGPGSQNAANKGHEFESQDRLRGDRTIPYSVMDEVTRAEHNARIIEGNKARQQATCDEFQANAQMTSPGTSPEAHPAREPLPIHARTSEDREQQRLREAQGQDRRAMYKDQRHDREALREAQAAGLDRHKAWAKDLYATARKSAFEEVKEQTSDRWKQVRSIQDPAQRDKAAEALKAEQKSLYAKTATARVAEMRPQKNEAWQAITKAQAKERLDLRTTHREEAAAMSRQHIAERIGTEEQQRAQHLQRDTNRIAARMSGHQGMANQQKAALKTIRLKHNARQASRADSLPQNPAKAAKTFMKTAVAEHDKRGKIRAGLNAQRQSNQLRAATPDRFRAQAGKAMHDLAHVTPDPQTMARQAAESGRTLTSDERANASPETKANLDRQDKASRSWHRDSFSSQQQKGKDNGRSGGGRGR